MDLLFEVSNDYLEGLDSKLCQKRVLKKRMVYLGPMIS
jgi:hypothetical protein